MALTDGQIRGLKATGKTFTVWDSKVVGLGVQVSAGGTRSYVLRYQVAGRKRQAILSRVDGVRLADMRKRAAGELLKARVDGAGLLERQHEAKAAPTVADLAGRFLSDHAPAQIKARRMVAATLAGYRNEIRRDILPVLGKMRIEAVTRRDVERLAERMASSPTAKE